MTEILVVIVVVLAAWLGVKQDANNNMETQAREAMIHHPKYGKPVLPWDNSLNDTEKGGDKQ